MSRPPAVEDEILGKYDSVLHIAKPDWEYDGASNYMFGGLDAFSVLEAGIRELSADKVRILDVGCGGGGFLREVHKRYPNLGGFVGLTGDTYGSVSAESGYPWIAFDPTYFDAFPDLYCGRYQKLYNDVLGHVSRDAGDSGVASHSFIYGVPVEQLGFFLDSERFFNGRTFDFIFLSWTFVHVVDPIGMLSSLYKLLRPSSGVLLGNTFVPLFAQQNSLLPVLEWMWVLRSKNLQLCIEDESVFIVHNGTADCTTPVLRYSNIVDRVWRTILTQQQRSVLSYDLVTGPDLSIARDMMQKGNSIANVICERFPALCSDGGLYLSKWNGSVPLAVQQVSRRKFKEEIDSSTSDEVSWQPAVISRCWVVSEAGESTYEKRNFLSMEDMLNVIAESGKRVLNVLDLSEGCGNMSVVELEVLPEGGVNSKATAFVANLDQLSSPPPEWFAEKGFTAFDVIVCWNPQVFSKQICDPLGVLCRLYNDFLAPGGTLLIGGLSADIISEEGISDDSVWLFAWAEYLREWSFRITLRVDSEARGLWWLQRKPPCEVVDTSSDAYYQELLIWPNIAVEPLMHYHGFTARSRVLYRVAKRHGTSSYNYDLPGLRNAVFDKLATEFDKKLSVDKSVLGSLVLPSTRSRSCNKVEKRLSLLDVASWDGSADFVPDEDGMEPKHGNGTERCVAFLQAEGVKDSFFKLDTNKDGYISKEELKELISLIDLEKVFSDENIMKIFEEVDFDKDNRLRYVEFVDWCFGTGMISDGEKSQALADAKRVEGSILAARAKPKPKPKARHRSSSRAGSAGGRKRSGSPAPGNRTTEEGTDVGASVKGRSDLHTTSACKPVVKDSWSILKEMEGSNYPKAALAVRKAQHVYYREGEGWKEWLRMSFSSNIEWNRYIRSSIFEL